MTPKEVMTSVFAGRKVSRIPFAPAIYEHKAYLIGKKPSELAKDANLLSQAILTEWETYKPDLITVGLDVYNIEAEALGCEIRYYSHTKDVPVIKKPAFMTEEDLIQAQVPDPQKNDRMPLMIEAGQKTLSELGDQVFIRGGMSGPFTLASNLCGQQRMLIETYKNTSFAQDLLELSLQTLIRYSEAWIKAGLEVIVFDSLSSPPMISPKIYSEVIKPYHVKLFDFLDNFELSHKPLIIGGNTTDIAEEIVKTGADLVICDYNADLDTYLRVVKEHDITLRVNLNPDLIRNGPKRKIKEFTSNTVNKGRELSRFILGTGVLVYDTPIDHVLVVKSVCNY